MYTAPLMLLVAPHQNNGKTFRADKVSCGIAMVVVGGWSPKMFLLSVPKISPIFPYVFFQTVYICGHLNLYIMLFFCNLLSLSLGAMRSVFNRVECPCMSLLLYHPFETSSLVPVCKVPLWRCSCCCCCCLCHHCLLLLLLMGWLSVESCPLWMLCLQLDLCCRLKGRDSKLQKSRVIYKFKCMHINCLEECIGEYGRTFGDRPKGTS